MFFIGSGIFIVSADIVRQVQSPGLLLLVWGLSGVITVLGALTFTELAEMFPRAGGQQAQGALCARGTSGYPGSMSRYRSAPVPGAMNYRYGYTGT